MAADLLIEMKDDMVFMERLRTSSMIEIKCFNPATKQDTIVRMPEAIACSLSGRISKLVGTGEAAGRESTMNQLMGGAAGYYQTFVYPTPSNSVLLYLNWFVEWIYTSKLQYKQELRLFDMWIFATMIECPRLQNEAAKMLGRNASWRSNVSLDEKKLQYQFANHRFVDTMMHCAKTSGCMYDLEESGFKEDSRIDVSYWDDKKHVLFLLDCAVYFGPGDRRVRRIVDEGYTQVTVLIMKRMAELYKDGGEQCPWEQKNIGRYLVVEPRNTSSVSDATMMSTPAPKRSLASLQPSSPSVASNGAKRIKQAAVNDTFVKQNGTPSRRRSDASATIVPENAEHLTHNGEL